MLLESGATPEQAIAEWNKLGASQGSYQVPDRSADGFGTMSSQMQPDPQRSLALMQSHDFANESTPYRQVAQWQAEQDSVSSSNRRAIEAALAGLLRPVPTGSTESWAFGDKSSGPLQEFNVSSNDAGMIPEQRWPQIQQLMQNLQALDVLDSNKQKLAGGELALEEARANPERLTKVDAKGGVTLNDPSKIRIAELRDATANKSIESRERIAARRDAILRDAQEMGADIKIAAHRLQLAEHYRKLASRQKDEGIRAELEARAADLESMSEGVGNEPSPVQPRPQAPASSTRPSLADLE